MRQFTISLRDPKETSNKEKIPLEEIAVETGAESYSVQSPENLIEVFMGFLRTT